jgi:hypothetical protein
METKQEMQAVARRQGSRFAVRIVGIAPMLLNRFREEDEIAVSNSSKSSIRTKSRRTPEEIAESKLYTCPKGKPILPAENLLAALIDGGRFLKAGRKQLTTQKSSLIPAFVALHSRNGDGYIYIEPGKWVTDSRPVVNPSTSGRMMCHRPRFDEWSLEFEIEILSDEMHPDTVREVLDHACCKVGIGDYRPIRKGPFGRFRVDSWKAI